ncbi:MFS transporter [Achromobacter marplatensis]|uniref:MFS transporter n=1 Tax=Achromobacter marplatensis TaxID=470868 RepID=UPI0039F68E76
MLILAQALIGVLSLAALNRLVTDITADRLEVAARQIGDSVETGLRLGKPLGQFFGLEDLLRSASKVAPELTGLAVYLPNGQVLAQEKRPSVDVAPLVQALTSPPNATLGNGLVPRVSGAISLHASNQVVLAIALKDAAGALQGAVVLSTPRDTEKTRALIIDNVRLLILVTLVVGIGLVLTVHYAVPNAERVGEGRARLLAPLLALMLAQGVYASYTIHTFRNAWLDVTRSNVLVLAEGLQRGLNRVLDYGVPIDRLRGIETPFARLSATFPAIDSIELTDSQGRILNRAGAKGPLPVSPSQQTRNQDEAFTLVLPLGQEGAAPQARGNLIVRLSSEVIAAGVRARALDAMTVTVVAVVAASEMLLLLWLLIERAYSTVKHRTDGRDIGRVTRPVMFGFLFAWALPLGFLPIFARSLPAEGLTIPLSMSIALPISVEMACGLLAALAAGRLSDHKSWRLPVILGIALTFMGMVSCSLAMSQPAFIGARGLVGIGYGLTWMGLQGVVVTRSPTEHRGRNMTGVIAGVFAGHLSGAAVGAMLMEQLGPRAVFLVGAVMLVLPLVGVLTVMRAFRGRPVEPPLFRPSVAAGSLREHIRQSLRLFRTRDFALLLIGSVVPFSMSQVGLLSYALPLYLEADGVAASSIGRVLMIYGLCIIYLGPIMGRIIDRSSVNKRWIVAGGMIGGAGMLGLYFHNGMAAAMLGVLALGLASCCIGASQAAYMLALPQVQAYGAAGALGILRASDKLGQMAGPLIVGAAIGTVGMHAGLALIGAFYLTATLAFLVFARCGAKSRGTSPPRATPQDPE